MFCRSGAAERERVSEVFSEVLLKVLDRLEVPSRVALAERICAEDRVPGRLLKKLASDEEIEVATPVILNARSLGDEDFASIVAEVSSAHMLVMCQRRPIRPVLSRVLAERGDAEVLRSLTRNHAATLGGDTFDLLVARARKDTSLQEALGDRPDMPGAAAERMVPFLSRELIQRIRENGRNEALVTAIETRSAREVEIQLLEFSGAASKTQQFIDSAVEGKVPVDVAVSSFAEKDRAFELAQLLARKVDWPDNVVVPLVFREDEKPLLVLCRVCGVTEKSYGKVVRMRSKRMRLSSATASESLRRYEELGAGEARNAFIAMAKKLKLPANL
jgi:hypothetical protein